MRVKATGKYEVCPGGLLRYIFYAEDGKPILTVTEGKSFYIEQLKFFPKRRVTKLGKACLSVNVYDGKRKIGKSQNLVENFVGYLAQTANSAIRSLYTFCGSGKNEKKDKLDEVLEKLNFASSCVISVQHICCEEQVKYTYNEKCRNFVSENKNNYRYFLFSDAKVEKTLAVINTSCTDCKRKMEKNGLKCDCPMRTEYYSLKGGNYYVLIRMNVRTSKAQVIKVVTSSDIGRLLAAEKLEEFVK